MNVASIPGWSAKDGDEIICIAELKLGLIGMSCIVPGFSTMVCMLLFSRDLIVIERNFR